MNRIVEYKILSDSISWDDPSLAKQVNDYIAKGWQPYGDVIVDSMDNNSFLKQAIVRYAEEEAKP